MRFDSGMTDEVYQEQILPHVSRTFALTIPQLPPGLRTAVTSAYLLCRIADTIEDEPALSAAETFAFLQRFTAVVYGREEAALLARELEPRLSDRTLPAERDLVRNMERVVRVTVRLHEQQRAAIHRCIEVMCYGMHRFQSTASVHGLPLSSDLDSYCYYVAGVVGEMLTELFCGHSPRISQRRAALHGLAVSFAQGLQMTNILKDVWEDRRRGACWLPQELFTGHGVDLAQLSPERYDARFHAGVREVDAVPGEELLRQPAGPVLHVADSRRGAGRPAFLSVGHRSCRAHTAQHRAHSAIHGRLAGEGVTRGGRHDSNTHESGGAQRPDTAAPFRARRQGSAARGAIGRQTACPPGHAR